MTTTYALRQAAHAAAYGQVPLISGETDDIVLCEDYPANVARAMAHELRRLYAEERPLVAVFDVAAGLRADDHREAADLRRLYGQLLDEWPDDVPGRPQPLAAGQQLHDLSPVDAIAAVDALMRQSLRSVGVVIDQADLVLHEAFNTDAGRFVVAHLRSAIGNRGRVHPAHAKHPLVLIASDPAHLGGGFANHPLVQNIVLGAPALDERRSIVRRLGLDEGIAQRSAGISRHRLETLAGISSAVGTDASSDRLVRVALNGMPRRPWTAEDREDIRTRVAGEVRDNLPGQEAVVDRVCQALAVAGMPRLRAGGPRDVFLLAGPPAVGKTELSRLLARSMFGDAGAIGRFDMTEYMEAHSRAKLIGAPPGYVGFEGGGQLTDWVMANPDSIVLLDEIEKAHEQVLLLLLQILEDGRLTDGRGRTVDFSGIVLLMTTNMGSGDAIKEMTAGLADPDADDLARRIVQLIQAEMQTPKKDGGRGRPELWSRLQGSVIPFDVVRRSNVPRVAARLLRDFQQAANEAGFALRLDVDGVAQGVAADARFRATEGTWDTRTVLAVLREQVEAPVRERLARETVDGPWKVEWHNGRIAISAPIGGLA